MCCSVLEKKVPLLMRSIYMQNKTLIGKVDDVFGPVTAPGIAIKPADGVKGESFKAGDQVRNTILSLRRWKTLKYDHGQMHLSLSII